MKILNFCGEDFRRGRQLVKFSGGGRSARSGGMTPVVTQSRYCENRRYIEKFIILFRPRSFFYYYYLFFIIAREFLQ